VNCHIEWSGVWAGGKIKPK